MTIPLGLKTFSRKSVSFVVEFWFGVLLVVSELTLLPLRLREVVTVDGGDTSFRSCRGFGGAMTERDRIRTCRHNIAVLVGSVDGGSLNDVGEYATLVGGACRRRFSFKWLTESS
jgi:hypothetical protein